MWYLGALLLMVFWAVAFSRERRRLRPSKPKAGLPGTPRRETACNQTGIADILPQPSKTGWCGDPGRRDRVIARDRKI